MENSSYIGLSRQIALGRKMDIVSNNIANIDTAQVRIFVVCFVVFASLAIK